MSYLQTICGDQKTDVLRSSHLLPVQGFPSIHMLWILLFVLGGPAQLHRASSNSRRGGQIAYGYANSNRRGLWCCRPFGAVFITTAAV